MNNSEVNDKFRDILDKLGNKIISKIQNDRDIFIKCLTMDLIGLINDSEILCIENMKQTKFYYEFDNYWFHFYLNINKIKIKLFGIRGNEFYFIYEFGQNQNDFFQLPRTSRLLYKELDKIYSLMILDNEYRYYNNLTNEELENELDTIDN